MPSYAVPLYTTPRGNRFPKDEKIKKTPSTTIKRDEFECKIHTMVCSKHVKPQDCLESYVDAKFLSSPWLLCVNLYFYCGERCQGKRMDGKI